MVDILASAIMLFLGWLFAGAAWSKLRAPQTYRELGSFYLAVNDIGHRLVFLLAFIELAIAVFIIAPIDRSLGLAAAAVLLTLYAGLMAWRYLGGFTDLRCGCSGADSTLRVGPALVLRNILFAGMALLSLAMDAVLPGTLSAWGGVFLGVIVLISVYWLSDQAIAHAQAMAEDV